MTDTTALAAGLKSETKPMSNAVAETIARILEPAAWAAFDADMNGEVRHAVARKSSLVMAQRIIAAAWQKEGFCYNDRARREEAGKAGAEPVERTSSESNHSPSGNLVPSRDSEREQYEPALKPGADKSEQREALSMTHTEKRIEVLKLLKLTQKEGEKTGDTILRALRHLVGYDTPDRTSKG